LPAGAAAARLARNAMVLAFVRETYRHGKAMLATGTAQDILAGAGLPAALPDGTDDPGVVRGKAGDKRMLERFIAAVAAHRIYARETDPPAV
jgi:catalase